MVNTTQMLNKVFRTCPDTGLKFHGPAENLIKANAVAAAVEAQAAQATAKAVTQ